MMMGMHLLIGRQEFLDLIRFMIQDIKNYPKFEGKKILWIHLLPFYQETLQSYFNSSRKYQIIASDIIMDSMKKWTKQNRFTPWLRRSSGIFIMVLIPTRRKWWEMLAGH